MKKIISLKFLLIAAGVLLLIFSIDFIAGKTLYCDNYTLIDDVGRKNKVFVKLPRYTGITFWLETDKPEKYQDCSLLISDTDGKNIFKTNAVKMDKTRIWFDTSFFTDADYGMPRTALALRLPPGEKLCMEVSFKTEVKDSVSLKMGTNSVHKSRKKTDYHHLYENPVVNE